MKKTNFTSYRRLNGYDEVYWNLPTKDRKKLVALLHIIEQQGLLVATKMEWVKKLDTNLYELRSKVASNIQRGLYFHDEDNRYIITHGFTKKTQKTPINEIKHAREIRAEYYQRKDNDS